MSAAPDRYASLVLAAMIDGVLIVDRSWTVTFLNPAGRKLLVATAYSVGQSFWTFFPAVAYGDPAHTDCYRGAMNRSESCDFENFYSDPINRWIQVRASPTPEGMIVFFRDTTQQRRALAALIESEANAALKRFTSTFAGEVSYSLQTLADLLLLAHAHCSDPGVHAYLNPAEQEVHRISEAIRTRLGTPSKSSES